MTAVVSLARRFMAQLDRAHPPLSQSLTDNAVAADFAPNSQFHELFHRRDSADHARGLHCRMRGGARGRLRIRRVFQRLDGNQRSPAPCRTHFGGIVSATEMPKKGAPHLQRRTLDMNSRIVRALTVAATVASFATVATANETSSAIDHGDGTLEYAIVLPSGQAFVELFVRQNGIQNIAFDISRFGTALGDGTTRYAFTIPNFYEPGTIVEYRFYHYMP